MPYGGKGVGKSKGKSEEPKGKGKGSKGGDRSEGLSVETQRDILTTMVRHRDLRIAELEAEVAELKEAIAKQGATMMDVTGSMNRLTEQLMSAQTHGPCQLVRRRTRPSAHERGLPEFATH